MPLPPRQRQRQRQIVSFTVARLRIQGDRLVLRLNMLEKAAGFVVRSPSVGLASVRQVDATSRPGRVRLDVDLGFTGNGAPAAFLIKAHGRGRFDGGRAAVFVYLSRPSIRVYLDDDVWRLFLVSTKQAGSAAEELREAVRRHIERRP